MEWYYTNMVLERMFHFIWLHPGWTLFIVYTIFHNTVIHTGR